MGNGNGLLTLPVIKIIFMKQLFHIAIQSQQYNSSGITKAFENCGYNVTQFDWQPHSFQIGREGMREACVAMAKRIQPDVIFIHAQNKDSFDRKTLSQLSDIGFTINYTFDVRDDISWYQTMAPYVGLTVFACVEDVESCKRSGIENVAWVPSSADFSVYARRDFPYNRIVVPEIVFIGNNTVGTNLNYPRASQRQDMIAFMEKAYGERFVAFGWGQKGGMITDPLHEVEIYNKAKIVITHNNFFKTGYCSDRDWRAVGCGTFTIHQYFEMVHRMFGQSAVVWSGFEDLKYLCDYFLIHEGEREMLAQAHTDYVTMGQTWTHRVRHMCALIPKQEKIKI